MVSRYWRLGTADSIPDAGKGTSWRETWVHTQMVVVVGPQLGGGEELPMSAASELPTPKPGLSHLASFRH